MQTVDFVTSVKSHLAAYKNVKFSGSPNGEWVRKGKTTPLNYAFIPEEKEKNFISHYKDRFTKSKFWIKGKDQIKPHSYMHHLNSSQAMCINFFYPLLIEEQLDIIFEFLGIEDEKVDYNSVCFEKLSLKDCSKNRRPTNFDFYFKTLSGKEFFFEIKYTEYEFGKAKEDAEHIEKYNEVYCNFLESIREEYKTMAAFLENYQLMRNLIHIDDNSLVIFLYPRQNTKVKNDALKAKNQLVDERYQSHVYLIEWENLHAFITQRIICSNDLLMSQLEEFNLKYIIPS